MYEKELRIAKKAALLGGRIVKNFYGRNFWKREKGEGDVVTRADFSSEKAIRSLILKQFPSDAILGEEEGLIGKGERIWAVDPLDGTINFSRCIDNFMTSVCLCDSGYPVAAACFDPSRNYLFTGVKGKGAFKNGEKIHVSKIRELDEMTFGFSIFDVRQKESISMLSRIAPFTHRLRHSGSTVNELCKIAEGKHEFYFSPKNSPWDYAAGMLLIKEAGGMCTDLNGREAGLHSKSFLFSNNTRHPELLRILNGEKTNA